MSRWNHSHLHRQRRGPLYAQEPHLLRHCPPLRKGPRAGRGESTHSVTSKDLLYSTGNSSLLHGSLDGREVQGEMDTCACMAESLCHSSETITILLISYTLIQNKRFFKNSVLRKSWANKINKMTTMKKGFPGGSDGKEFACNAGDLGSIPGLGRSPGHGNPLQYSCLENPMDRGAWWVTVHGVTELDTTEQLKTHTMKTSGGRRGGWGIEPAQAWPSGILLQQLHRVVMASVKRGSPSSHSVQV